MPRGDMSISGAVVTAADEMPTGANPSQSIGEPGTIELPGSWRLTLVPVTTR
jgi:hypothetical protein